MTLEPIREPSTLHPKGRSICPAKLNLHGRHLHAKNLEPAYNLSP